MNKLIEENDPNPNINNREILKSNNENSNRTQPIASNSLNQQKTTNSQIDKINQQEQIKAQIKKEKKSYYGHILIFCVLLLIIEQYITYVFIIEIKNIKCKNNYLIKKNKKKNFFSKIVSSLTFTIIRLIFFNILFILLLSAFYLTSRTNPGAIPLYWGFYIGDQEYKKKRYCLLCQVFKPDRAHHCSICNTCVLNMDHHCPWVNNCIGFYNRKFFIQLLFYFFLSVCYLDIVFIPHTYNSIMKLYKERHTKKISFILFHFFIILNHCIDLVLTYLDFEFFRFHIKLVFKNCTTIETLDPDFDKKNKFNLSLKQNWEQVMGNNKIFWFIPFIIDTGYPIGDGLTWPVNELADELNESDIKKNFDKNKSNSSFNSNNKFNRNLPNNFGTNTTAYESNNNVIRKNLGNNVLSDNSKNIEMNEQK